MGAETIRIDQTLWISQLTLTVVVEEVKSVTVDAYTSIIEHVAVGVRILASTVVINVVPFDTFLTG